MFSDIFLNPKILNKDDRRNKIKNLSIDNIILKNNFTGFNYTIIKKEEIFKKDNFIKIDKYVRNINIPIYEVLSYDTPTKIYLDCEMEFPQKVTINNKEELFLKFNTFLLKFLDNKFPNKNKEILYADSSREKENGNYKLSLHVVVNRLGYFVNRKQLKNIVLEFIDTLPKDDFFRNCKSFVDEDVYHGSQLFRIIYSPNNNKNSILKPFIIKNNKIVYQNVEYISNNYDSSLCGIYSNYNNYNKLDKIENNEFKYQDISIERQVVSTEIPDWKIKWIENNIYVKNIYIIDGIEKNKIHLKRINSNTCNLCKRVHEKENAMCKVYKNNIMFYCNRNKNGGVSIGSWYTNRDDKIINNNEKNIINELKIENNNLKEKIKELEEIITNLKLINQYIPHKNTTHKSINKNNNIFENYYEAGKLIINNKIDDFKKIISQHWMDRNVSKLKNRCIRIYQLLNFMKENNFDHVKYSLRSIFHLPNWKFDEYLKNNTFFT